MANKFKVTKNLKELAEEYAPTINYYKEQFLNDIIEIEDDDIVVVNYTNNPINKLCTLDDWKALCDKWVNQHKD